MVHIARSADAAAPDVEDAACEEMAVGGFEGGVGEVGGGHVVVVGGGCDGGGVCCGVMRKLVRYCCVAC